MGKDPTHKAISEVQAGLTKLMDKSFGAFGASTMQEVADRDLAMIPTDFLDLNRISGGSLFGFMPEGNITVMAGKEASGKSLIAYNVLKNAQECGLVPILVETEHAVNPKTLSNAGVDVATGGMVLQLGYVEQCIVALDNLIHQFVKKGIRPCIVLDSLGNLDIEKSVKDIAKGEIKQDMGLFQKTVKTMLKHICHLCAHHNIPFIIVTHIFFDPSPYGGGAKVYGGQHLKFLANTTIFLTSAKKKDKTGFDLKALTLKNRLAPPLQEATIEIDIRTSQANRYAGLLQPCVDLELFEKSGAFYYVPHLDKKFQGASQIYQHSQEIFTPEFLRLLDEEIQNNQYNTITFSDGALGSIMTDVEAGARDVKGNPVPSEALKAGKDKLAEELFGKAEGGESKED